MKYIQEYVQEASRLGWA